MTEFIGICLGGKADGYEMRSYAPFVRSAGPVSMRNRLKPGLAAHDAPVEADDYRFVELRGPLAPDAVRFGVWLLDERTVGGSSAGYYLALAELARDARRHRASRK